MYQAFLIKYGEIGVKGKNRHIFEDTLVSQTANALKLVDGEFCVRKENGRVYVEAQSEFDFEEAVEALSHVFGIVGICPVVLMEDEGFDALAERVVDYVGEAFKEQDFTFKVITRRARKNYPMDSMEVSAALGERLLAAYPKLKVDVHTPQVTLHIEIRNKINLYSKTIPGPGGMPVGSAGRAMLLLSGGIDSPVAGYMIAKRGVKIDAVYFHAPPYTSERAKQKVIDLAKILAKYTGPIRLHIVNFTDIQLSIYEKCPHDQLTIIMRRYMMKLAEHFAGEEESMGLVTGESIGQVASQTMQSLAVTNEVCTLPVYRPLIDETSRGDGRDDKGRAVMQKVPDHTGTLHYEARYGLMTSKIASTSSSAWMARSIGLERSRLKIPIIDFASITYLPEIKSKS